MKTQLATYIESRKNGLKAMFSTSVKLPAFIRFSSKFIRIDNENQGEEIITAGPIKFVKKSDSVYINYLFNKLKFGRLEEDGYEQVSKEEYLEAKAKVE